MNCKIKRRDRAVVARVAHNYECRWFDSSPRLLGTGESKGL